MKLEEYYLTIKRLILAFTLYPLVRILFLFLNLDLYREFDISELLYPLLYGIRFDVSTLLIANSLFIILSLIPLRVKVYEYFLKVIFVFSNFVTIGVSIIDLEFFKFNGKRLTIDIFGIAGDMSNQIFQIISYYWYFVLIIFLSFIFYWSFYPKLGKYQNPRIIRLRWTPLIGLVTLIITFVGIRGGTQIRSISPKQAYIFGDYDLGHLAINSAYTLIRSIKEKNIQKIKYYENDNKAIEIIAQYRKSAPKFSGVPKSNIVVIIVESLSQEYVDGGYAPFFKSLSSRGLYFDRNFANGRRSIEALPSILVGIPSLLDKPLYQSQFQTNKFNSLASILKKNGYSTSFFHGGKTGTMDFDAYTSSIGFEKYFGMEDYPNQRDFDGSWGIYDDKFLKWFGEKLSEEKQPFVSTVFTLSSHQPYSIPKEFQNRFSKGSLEIHESIGYADESLRLFFESIKEEEWFKNTLFVITADHTQKSRGLKYNSTLGKYRVPLLFYHPSFDLKADMGNKVTQHADILPSILNFLGIEQKKELLYGSSVFSENNGPILNYINNSFILYYDGHLIRLNNENFRSFTVSESLHNESKSSVVHTKLEELLRAYIQYTINGLIKNDLYK